MSTADHADRSWCGQQKHASQSSKSCQSSGLSFKLGKFYAELCYLVLKQLNGFQGSLWNVFTALAAGISYSDAIGYSFQIVVRKYIALLWLILSPDWKLSQFGPASHMNINREPRHAPLFCCWVGED